MQRDTESKNEHKPVAQKIDKYLEYMRERRAKEQKEISPIASDKVSTSKEMSININIP